jgi:hypothetical protein
MGISFIAPFVRKVDYLYFCLFLVACRMDIILHSFVKLVCWQACECVSGMFWIYLFVFGVHF